MKVYDVLYYEININISACRRVLNKFHTNLQFKYYNLFIKSIRVDRMFYAMLWYALATDNLRTCYEIVSYRMIIKCHGMKFKCCMYAMPWCML